MASFFFSKFLEARKTCIYIYIYGDIKVMKVSKLLFSGSQRWCLGFRGACAIPHPEKAFRGGEDAFFSHPYGIGVADGVGGYARENIDPAIYTRNVMKYCLEVVKDKARIERDGISALQCLNYGAYMAQKEGSIGGCPATVVTIKRERVASILNLGDCGTIIVRNGKIIFQSKQQQHSFNCPFQLPSDLPSSGESSEVDVGPEDVILCASDGVFDNLDLDDIVVHIKETAAIGCSKVAERIAEHASTGARDSKFMSPFANNAKKAGYFFQGGKLDDITVVIGVVTPVSSIKNDGIELISDLFPLNK